MLKIGLTGGIGSGKSLVASVFQKLDVPVYISDIKAKELMNSNDELINKLKAEFGKDVYINNQIDRKKIASLIFGNDELLSKINSIVHPYVRVDFNKWCKLYTDKPYIINESAIVFSSGLNRELDKVISVIAPKELRIRRVISRDNSSREQIEKIITKQLSDDELIKKSDFVLNNNEQRLLIPQILELHKSLGTVN